MDTEIIVALLGVAGTLSAAIATSWISMNKKITGIQIKTDMLWKIYAEDALRQARQAGFVISQSPDVVTSHWVSRANGLDESIRSTVEGVQDDDVHKITAHILDDHADEIIGIAKENDVPASAVLGAIFTIVRDVIECKGNKDDD